MGRSAPAGGAPLYGYMEEPPIRLDPVGRLQLNQGQRCEPDNPYLETWTLGAFAVLSPEGDDEVRYLRYPRQGAGVVTGRDLWLLGALVVLAAFTALSVVCVVDLWLGTP